MEAIGGFFELELRKGKEYHPNAMKLNTGRNAIEYVLKHRGYSRGFIPYYSCDSILEPFKKLGIPYDFYHIGEDLLPAISPDCVSKETCILIINYFGLLGKQIEGIAYSYPNVIVDNSQAFFAPPLEGIDTVYSPRKFFGVPDGAYLYTDLPEDPNLERDISFTRCEHLLKRIDLSPEEGYSDFRKAQQTLSYQPIKKMSKLTETMLSSINYDYSKKRREESFLFLHNKLKNKNYFSIIFDKNNISCAMVYPFLNYRFSLRENLIQNKIYVATYWHEVVSRIDKGSFEFSMAKSLLPLPIDQRYSSANLKGIFPFFN